MDTTETVIAARDSKRPRIEDVVRILDGFFSSLREDPGNRNIVDMGRGPLTWAWADMTMAHLGFEKWFVLTESLMPGAEGFPLLTIRQSTAPRLDSWLSVSSLVLGPSDIEIEASLTLALVNHTGALDGLRQAIHDVITGMTGNANVDDILRDVAQDLETKKGNMN